MAQHFTDHFNVAGYQPDWTKHYFVEGFREHTRLIYTQPSPDFTARLFQRIRGDSNNKIDCGAESLAPYFAGDSSRQIPRWWDYANTGEIECAGVQIDDWYSVFGYAREHNILYMLIESH